MERKGRRRRGQLTISIQSDKVLDSNWRLQLQSDDREREMMGKGGREEGEEILLLFIFSLLKNKRRERERD